ncbi:MAG: hypothetical protein HUN04_22730 [Desulfobacter sp.]|nr:MAG: hypothetical protein HUN04_22730 [Desulfobacter sp.]
MLVACVLDQLLVGTADLQMELFHTIIQRLSPLSILLVFIYRKNLTNAHLAAIKDGITNAKLPTDKPVFSEPSAAKVRPTLLFSRKYSKKCSVLDQ